MMRKNKVCFMFMLFVINVLMVGFIHVDDEGQYTRKRVPERMNDTVILTQGDVLMIEVFDTTGNALRDIVVACNQEKSAPMESNAYQLSVSRKDSIVEIYKENFKTFRLKLIVQKKEKEVVPTVMFLNIQLVKNEDVKESKIRQKKIRKINVEGTQTVVPVKSK